MRTSRVVAVGAVMAAILLCWFNTVHAGPSLWPNNKGEICLHNIDTGEIARLAVVHTVGNHYLVHGYNEESSGKTMINGNAFVDGDTILMHVSTTGYDSAQGEAFGFNGKVVLDANTLEGWVAGVTFHCEGNPADDNCGLGNDGIQYLEPIACP